MQNLTFNVGEVRKLEFTVSAQCPDDFLVIASAMWNLKTSNGDVSASGDCEIDGDKISMLIPFENRGGYVLDIIAEIPPETVIETLYVTVV